MKYYFFLPLLFALSSCSKDNSNKIIPPKTSCTVQNQGIFVSDQPKPFGASNKVKTFKIDSVVLKENRLTLWFTQDGSNERLKASLKRYDNGIFQSGEYYFVDSSTVTPQSSFDGLGNPVVFFDIKSLNSPQNAYFLYDLFPVCISNENGKFGIFIDGMKVADTRTGNSSEFLTFSLESNQIIVR